MPPRSDTEPIRSRRNPLLQRARGVGRGDDPQTVLLEGERLVRDALGAGVELECVLVDQTRPDLAEGLAAGAVRAVAPDLLRHVSTLSTPPPLVALARRPPLHPLEILDGEREALVVVLCGVQDPGNLGAIARSAEAFGARALAVLPPSASPFAPKSLRGSMGSLLRLPLLDPLGSDRERSAAALRRELELRGFRSLRARTRGGTPLEAVDWSGRLALWIGAETGEWPASLAEVAGVSIPMGGGIESLNVAVATSILLHEAARARRTPSDGAAR